MLMSSVPFKGARAPRAKNRSMFVSTMDEARVFIGTPSFLVFDATLSRTTSRAPTSGKLRQQLVCRGETRSIAHPRRPGRGAHEGGRHVAHLVAAVHIEGSWAAMLAATLAGVVLPMRSGTETSRGVLAQACRVSCSGSIEIDMRCTRSRVGPRLVFCNCENVLARERAKPKCRSCR